MITKTFEKDEIKFEFKISDNGYLENIVIITKDKEFFNPIPNDKRILDRVCNQLFITIGQLLSNVKPVKQKIPVPMVQMVTNEKKTIKRKCSNCDNDILTLVKPCCEEKKILAKEGIVAVLECNNCKQRAWIKKDEYDELMKEINNE